MSENKIIYFHALEWFQRTAQGITNISFEFSAPEVYTKENGEEDLDYRDFFNTSYECWIEHIETIIHYWNRKKYKVIGFTSGKGVIDDSGPIGRGDDHHCHIEHTIIIVLEK